MFEILFYVNAFIIVWAMVGYRFSLQIIGRVYTANQLKKDYSHQPTVTVMVAAYNEEKVILDKLNNMLEIDYPSEKIELLISSDNSTDRTNEIVRQFILAHTDRKIRLYEVKARNGKTNAQNEAQKIVKTEYLVMTDANAMMYTNAITELMAAFTADDIAYVTGKLLIVNQESSTVSNSEANYWTIELATRELESKIQTITGGNGAIYACRTNEYYDFDPIDCHDTVMPLFYALQGKRAICNHDAVAYEKASEIIEDEFQRKVRMNQSVIIKHILPHIKILNVFKYKWFTYFYLGHRTSRYLLWIAHLVVFITNAFIISKSWFYTGAFVGQVFFYLLAMIYAVTKFNNKGLTMIYYYCMTIIAQWVGVYNLGVGRAKPFWEIAERSR